VWPYLMRTALSQIVSGSSFLQHATKMTSVVREERQPDWYHEDMMQLTED
jgi:hypothetical protein